MVFRFALRGLLFLCLLITSISATTAQTPAPMAAGYILPSGPSDPLQFITDAARSGNYLYTVSSQSDALAVIDVSNPGEPKVVATFLDGEGGAIMNGPRAIYISGNLAYVVSNESRSLEIINIGDPMNPTHVGTLVDLNGDIPTDPGATAPFLTIPSDIVVSGGYAYIATQYGLEIVDVSDPANPEHESNLYKFPSPTPPTPPDKYFEFVRAVAVSGNYAFLLGRLGNDYVFMTVDITDPGDPEGLGTVAHGNLVAGPILSNPTGLVVNGNYAYVITDNDALQIIDITTPSTPSARGFIKKSSTVKLDLPRGVDVAGDYAYVVGQTSSALEIINIGNPLSPQHVTAILSGSNGEPPYLGSSMSISVSGNYAYIGTMGIQIMSIFTPGPPQVDKGVFGPMETIDQSTSFRYRWKNTSGLTYTLEVSTDNFATRLPGYDNVTVTGTTSQGEPGWLQNHVTGLTPNTTYKFRMKAVNTNGPSDPSSPITITTAPAAPVATAATGVEHDKFTVTWQAVAGATNYKLYLYDQGSLAFPNSHFNGYPTGNVLSFELSGGGAGILPAANYLYRIAAFNTNGESQKSNIINLTTKPYYNTFLAASGVTQTSFTANWAPYPDQLGVVTHYLLDVATDAAFTQLVAGYNNLNVGLVTSKSVDTGLSPGTTYYYRLRTANATGSSPDSPSPVSVTTVPPAPSLSAATAISGTGFTANWNAAAGATEYRLDVSTHNGFTSFVPGYNDKIVPASPTSHAVTGLVAGTTYYYRVRAHNSPSGTSGTTGVIEVITLPDPPVSAAATQIGQVVFTANWGAVTGASHYFLDVSTDALFSALSTGYSDLQVTGLSQSVTGLTESTTYYYRVRAANASGSSANSSTITVLTGPPAPVATAATTVGQTSFTATWGAVAGATGYKVDVATDATFPSFVAGFQDAAASTTSLNITGLAAGTTYYYRVRATNGTGASNYSNVISQITIPATPAIPSTGAVSLIGQTSFTINWTAATGAVDYFVDVKDVGGNALTGYSNVSTTATSLAVANGITAGTAYQYVVRAANSAGTSPSSVAQPVLTVPPTPVPAAAESITATGFKAKWEAATSATKYFISVATDAAFALSSIVSTYNNLDVGNVTTFDVSVTSKPGEPAYYYRVSAANGSGTSPASANITVNPPVTTFPTISLPTGGSVSNYRVISIPDGTTASTSLASESFEKSWRVMHFDGNGNTDVRDITKMLPGLGYWVNSNLAQAPTITVAGSFTTNTKTLTLKQGWNQIGDPFNFSISWADVRAKNSSVTGIGDLYIYTGSFTKSDGLVAFGGGFVNSTNAGNVTLTIPANVARFNGKVRGKYDIEGRDISGDEWFLPLTLRAGDVINDLGGIGMHRDANTGIDPFDAVALPRFFTYAELSSNHPEFFQPRFMRDVTPSAATNTWTLFATSNSNGGDADLSWDNTAWEGAAQIYLYDEQEGVLLDMKSTNQYHFRLSSSRPLRFFYGKHGNVSPEVTGFGQPFPNPSSAEVTFPYLAVKDDDVQVLLFDMTGRPVQTIGSRGITTGYREAIWDGTNQQGEKLPAGMYVYRYVSNAGKTSIGKVVLR